MIVDSPVFGDLEGAIPWNCVCNQSIIKMIWHPQAVYKSYQQVWFISFREGILVLSCCIINCHKLSGLKQHLLMFLWVRNLNTAYLGPLLRVSLDSSHCVCSSLLELGILFWRSFRLLAEPWGCQTEAPISPLVVSHDRSQVLQAALRTIHMTISIDCSWHGSASSRPTGDSLSPAKEESYITKPEPGSDHPVVCIVLLIFKGSR